MLKNDKIFSGSVLVNFWTLYLGNFLKLLVGQYGEKWLGNLLLCTKRAPKTHYLHKRRKMRTVPLDVAPERRTKGCTPRFRPGGRFWNQSSDTCRQAGRERGVGLETMCDKSLSSTRFNLLWHVISIYISMRADSFFQVVRIRMSWNGGYLTTAHVLF